MMPDVRRGLVTTLAELLELAPDVRLGQLMDFLGFLGEDQVGRRLADIDDDQLLAVMQRHRSDLHARKEDAEPPLQRTPGITLSVSGSPIPPIALPSAPTGN
jgi:hypothetical protein